MNLPPQLEKYRDIIESSKRDVIKITTSYDEDLGLLDSKLGGEPYWPESMEYPTDSSHPRLKLPMLLLAQINCEDLPKQDLLPCKGILQFFVTPIDSLSEQEHIKVVYHPTADESDMIDEIEDIIDAYGEETPLGSSFGLVKLDFNLTTQYVSTEDYHFASFFGENEFDDTTRQLYQDFSDSQAHTMGGYIYSVQGDVRRNSCPEHEILLLQLDTDDFISWGDCGTGYFFIKPSDLKKLDFSNVYFSWEC